MPMPDQRCNPVCPLPPTGRRPAAIIARVFSDTLQKFNRCNPITGQWLQEALDELVELVAVKFDMFVFLCTMPDPALVFVV